MAPVWKTPVSESRLEEGTLAVWRVALDEYVDQAEALSATLAPDETERAAQFRFDRDRVRYVVARAALRDVLGRYTGQPAGALRFDYNEYGKPHLAGQEAESPWAFNLSHAAGLALVAVIRGGPVGVDVEQGDRGIDVPAVAERFFTTGEAKRILELDGKQRQQAFFNAWTRKEALLKAKGTGVTFGLSTFEVSVEPDQPARVLGVNAPGENKDEWMLVDLNPSDGFIAAAATKGSVERLHCWEWTP